MSGRDPTWITFCIKEPQEKNVSGGPRMTHKNAIL